MSNENKLLNDAQNSEIVYETMKGLSDSQASEEKLWTAYTFGQLDYMRHRWPAKDAKAMKEHFLFAHGPHRSLFRNGISRLWWLGRTTKDKRYTDPYELTKFVCTHTDIIQSICEQPSFQNYSVMHGTLRAMYDLDKQYKQEESADIPNAQRSGVKIGKVIIQEIGKYINLVSGTYLLDIYDENEIYNIVQKHIVTYSNNAKGHN